MGAALMTELRNWQRLLDQEQIPLGRILGQTILRIEELENALQRIGDLAGTVASPGLELPRGAAPSVRPGETIYDLVIRTAKEAGAPVQYRIYDGEPVANRLQMVGHPSPLSIKLPEFEFMRDFIVEHDLKRGYEVATGFGASTLAIGLGMKATGGRVVTMDAYVEEHYGEGFAYEHKKDETYLDMDGFKSVKFLIEAFGLRDIVHPTVGWSPTDTLARIGSVFDLSSERLDFAFIDGGHWDDFAMNDVKAIMNILDRRFALFFHDTHMLGETFHRFIEDAFGQPIQVIESCKWPQGCFLGYVAKL